MDVGRLLINIFNQCHDCRGRLRQPLRATMLCLRSTLFRRCTSDFAYHIRDLPDNWDFRLSHATSSWRTRHRRAGEQLQHSGLPIAVIRRWSRSIVTFLSWIVEIDLRGSIDRLLFFAGDKHHCWHGFSLAFRRALEFDLQGYSYDAGKVSLYLSYSQ